ncbi:MAG: glycosyltransferase family 2 protein [Prosthecobacter sp.]|uniref:glycosyltransferase family 2 protein n=1 Tax=Prosthecobacter sp. TaxID=1965333 RepID=UPI0019ED5A74|nr:glycosyltransferase family A protein [Prosthecobacter sp.]MBE2286407.1 glycosyltransferase family 2 protein [Prosthecobacter sp.]
MGLVSVIVPTFNRAALIRRCFDSVVAQQKRPLQFIVADDCSTDDTAEAVRQLPANDGVEVVYLRQQTNRGVSAARNAALAAARGEWLALLDSDDVWCSDHLERLQEALQNTGADIAYSRGDIRESPEAPPSGRSSFGPTEHEERHIGECLYYYNFVLPSAMLVRAGFFEKTGFFDEDPEIQHAEDWDMSLRAAAAGLNFTHVRQATVYYTTPAQVPEAKKQMMMRRFIHCLKKHERYRGTSAGRRRFTLGYYTIWLGIMLGPLETESQVLFREARRLAWTTPSLLLPSFCGHLMPRLPGVLGRRVLMRLFRGLRARHRTLRGFPDPWD